MKTIVNASRIRHFLILPIWIFLIAACSQKPQVEISKFYCYSALDDPNYIQEWIKYDSIIFSDGSYAVMQLKTSPMNSLIRYIDSDGQLMSTVAAASETYPQKLIYGYDENGRLKYLLDYDGQLDTDFDHEYSEDDYMRYRLAIDSVDFRNPDLNRHIFTEIIYDEDGIAREITEQPSGKSIKAPENHRLDVRVVPCENFWYSDLNGGFFVLQTDIIPLNQTSDRAVERYEDFEKVVENQSSE